MSKIVTDDVLKELIAKLKTLINSKASTDDLDAKADAVHTHAITDVTNLQTTLNNKADATHTHDWDDIPNLETALSGKATVSYVNDKLALKADKVHTHAITDITDLQTTLDAKATTAYVDEQLSNVQVKEEDYNIYTSNLDENNIFTHVSYDRQDGTTYMNSVLSNPDDVGRYATCTWTFMDESGTTVTETKVWAIEYDELGNIISIVKQ